jgi:ABC-type hemin transport system ATPase subunit
MVTRKKPLTVQEMASMGGKARARKLSPQERSRIAKKAVAAREAKRSAKREPSK